jgi:protein-S-isoprenylcysteine O-methyltransferase Ste14
MNGFILLIPVLLIRYGLLYLINADALKRAAFFPQLIGNEKAAFWFYQISTVLIFMYMLFVNVVAGTLWFYAGMVIYCLGVLLLAVSVINYAKPSRSGINLKGLYRISRNPMYMAYFACFLGCVLLTKSPVLFVLIIVFQVSAHWIILSEERWCKSKFGDEYVQYMTKVNRYF